MDKTVDILLAEDSMSDIVMFREALKDTEWKSRLHVTRDGVETLDFLRQGDMHRDAPRPDLIVMDLNLPRITGLEVLTEIMRDPALTGIPVIILSGSEWERLTLAASGFPEDRYIVKAITYSGYIEVVKQIEGIWRKTIVPETDSDSA